MFRIALCDDEPIFLFQMQAFIDRWNEKPDEFQIEAFHDGDSLLHAHKESPFDIILLDVVMPLLNGIDTAKEIRRHDTAVKIVFLTGTPDYAVDSYTVKADNYLLKPIEPQQLFSCLTELCTELLQNSPCIMFKCANSMRKIPIQQIEYIEAQNKHVLLMLTNGVTLHSAVPLRSMENELPIPNVFFKCHRSYIVNLYQVQTYTNKEITMHSGLRIPISRSCQSAFEAAYFALSK